MENGLRSEIFLFAVLSVKRFIWEERKIEPWINNPQHQKEKIIKYLDDPFLNGMILSFLKDLNRIKLEDFGNFDIRIREVERDLILIGKEKGSEVVFNIINSAFEELAKPMEQRFEELGDVNEILKKEKPNRKSKTNYTGKITISELAKKRYNLEINSQNRCYCPFHKPLNSISFMFNDKNNTFRCWSCGEHGNMVQFVKLMEEKND